jgi:IclR family acetate operon transcriptional repressor
MSGDRRGTSLQIARRPLQLTGNWKGGSRPRFHGSRHHINHASYGNDSQTNQKEIRLEYQDRSADSPLARAFAILDFVATQGRPVQIAEIVAALGVPPPSAHRLAINLEERGMLQRALGSRKFVLGPAMVSLAFKALKSVMSDAKQRSILMALSGQISEQVEIAVVRENQVVFVETVKPVHASGLQIATGTEAPLHCTSSGKIFLSRLATTAREKLVRSLSLDRYTQATVTDADCLLRELATVRRRGWATNNEEFNSGVVGCAVPILGDKGIFIASLGVSAPIARADLDRVESFVPLLQAAAEEISGEIRSFTHNT